MQTENADLPIVVTGRHGDISKEVREFAHKKIRSLHLDYPKIIEAKIILDIESYRNKAEIILFCANHIVIEADTTTDEMHRSIDETIAKIARRMRKYKTRLLKSHRARDQSIRKVAEVVFPEEALDVDPVAEKQEQGDDHAIKPLVIHDDHYSVKPLLPEEAIMDLDLSDKPFVLFHNEQTGKPAVIYRRRDGNYGLIEP